MIQPDATSYSDVVLPQGLIETPVNAVTTKFVRAVSNKVRCPIFCTTWVPDGRRVICGGHSGEFTLWHGINLTFENSLQVRSESDAVYKQVSVLLLMKIVFVSTWKMFMYSINL